MYSIAHETDNYALLADRQAGWAYFVNKNNGETTSILKGVNCRKLMIYLDIGNLKHMFDNHANTYLYSTHTKGIKI